MVYAIDDATTFEFAKRVLQILSDSIQENSLPPAGFILVGNKFDLVRGREVSAEGKDAHNSLNRLISCSKACRSNSFNSR